MVKLLKLNELLKKIKKINSFAILIILVILSIFTINTHRNYQIEQTQYLSNFFQNIYFKKTIKSISNSFNNRFEKIDHFIRSGESFEIILDEIKIDKKERNKILSFIKKNKLKIILYENQKISFEIDNLGKRKIMEIIIPISKKRDLIISNDTKDKFSYAEIQKELNLVKVYKENFIKKSLYHASVEKKINPNIIFKFAQIYGFEVDFQRDIRKNDSFQIIYEEYKNDENKIVEFGDILYANLILRGKSLELYYFKSVKDNINDHFDANGQSIKRTLMKTPINGARLSSSFGKRKHPILGYTKLHAGTDFAAPTGTPIMASGSGVILKAGWCGGGGNCVKIRHNSTYSTVYAHMSKFARGIKKGIRVNQGQTIGYVGSTGMSTGPHLHYEVIKNGVKINSQTLKMPSGKKLSGKLRENFELSKIKIDVLKSELINNKN